MARFVIHTVETEKVTYKYAIEAEDTKDARKRYAEGEYDSDRYWVHTDTEDTQIMLIESIN